MKNLSILILSIIVLASCNNNKTANINTDKDISASYQLIERVIPGYSSQIKIEKITSGTIDVFEVDGADGKVVLRGNNPVSIASALNRYLKYNCNVNMSWCGNQMNLPEKLPVPQKKYRQEIVQKQRVYFNYCTLSYSASWWDWKRWEQEIDFMAMNGINMPLSVVGLEAVWYNTLLKYNFTDEEARSFLVGPAFFAWQWMTNIQSHPGVLPKSWIDKRIALGKKIIDRQIELGMMPIQQGFTGYVPRKMISKFPDSKILIEPKWCNFPGTAQLDPLDPLFGKIASTFYEEQKKLFGAHHFYAADPFHEGSPPQEGKEYLHKVGEAIINQMLKNDSLSTWVMQAWSIREDITKAAPKSKLLVLDLSGSTAQYKDYFWGYDYVVGNLHNFGGRINMHGDLKLLSSNKFIRQKGKAPNAVGTGYFMEAIAQNPVYYDLAFEMGISSDTTDIEKWLNNYAHRRYGVVSAEAEQAWKILLNTTYKNGTDGVEKSSIICARPALNAKKSGPNDGLFIPYDNKELLKALKLLMSNKNLYGSDAFKYDIVDILRQVLSNYGQIVHKKAAAAFRKKDKKGFELYSQKFLTLLKDVDRLLSTRQEFSFKKWVTDARSWGNNEDEKNFYDLNASTLITVWGPTDNVNEPIIFDYAWKEWSGLINQYYYKRWEMFYKMLDEHLENNTAYSEKNIPQVYGRESFRANDFYNTLADWELKWIKTPKQFDNIPNPDEIKVVKELLKRYSEEIDR